LTKPYSGFFDCFGSIYKQDGFTGLFRGNLISCLRYFPTQAINFAFKDHFKKVFPIRQTDSHGKRMIFNILSGAFAGAVSLAYVYPLDYIMTRLATDSSFTGVWDVITKTYEAEGIQGFYRGFLVSVLGVVVYRAIYFGMYDGFKVKIAFTNFLFILRDSL
jgi:solute carrier family 25 (adenine nucleotide translocator) protein 4/5/6/31